MQDEKEYNVYFQRQKKKIINHKSESIEKNKQKKKLKSKLTLKRLEKKIKNPNFSKKLKKDLIKSKKISSKNSGLYDLLKKSKNKQSDLKRTRINKKR